MDKQLAHEIKWKSARIRRIYSKFYMPIGAYVAQLPIISRDEDGDQIVIHTWLYLKQK